MTAPTHIRALRDASVLELEWQPDTVVRLPFRFLRGSCPCAGCVDENTGIRVVGEADVPADVAPLRMSFSGNYALKIEWSDGHDTGLYTFDALASLAHRRGAGGSDGRTRNMSTLSGAAQTRFGIYVYVDGYDLHDVADSVKRRLEEIAGHYPEVRVIDDRYERTPDMNPEDLPTWNLGLNFGLDQEGAGFVQHVLDRVRAVSRESNRSFVVGYCDRAREIDEDIGFIEPDAEADDIFDVLKSLGANA